MSKTGNRMHDDTTLDLMSGRVGAWCRQAYPRHGAKLMAADLGISERTSKALLSGSWPCQRTLADMIAKWGTPFIQFITEPAMQAGQPSLRENIHALRCSISAIESKLVELESDHVLVARRDVPVSHATGGGSFAGPRTAFGRPRERPPDNPPL